MTGNWLVEEDQKHCTLIEVKIAASFSLMSGVTKKPKNWTSWQCCIFNMCLASLQTTHFHNLLSLKSSHAAIVGWFFRFFFFEISCDPITKQSITDREFKQTSGQANKGTAGKPCRQGFSQLSVVITQHSLAPPTHCLLPKSAKCFLQSGSVFMYWQRHMLFYLGWIVINSAPSVQALTVTSDLC